MTATTVQDQIKDLEQQIKDLKNQAEAEAQAQRDTVRPTWMFLVEPAGDTHYGDKLHDPTCRLYRIKGVCTNKDEALAAGHMERSVDGGGMVYLYNTLTERLICSMGGGTVYVSDGFLAARQVGTPAEETILSIGAFIGQNPDGGDITDIIKAHNLMFA